MTTTSVYNKLDMFMKYNIIVKRIIYSLTPQNWRDKDAFYDIWLF